jgi:hypothetical protein
MPELGGATARESSPGYYWCAVPFETKLHAAFHPVQIKVPFTRRSKLSLDGCDQEAQAIAECSINLGVAHNRGLDLLGAVRDRTLQKDALSSRLDKQIRWCYAS